jgi:hypothetical protein
MLAIPIHASTPCFSKVDFNMLFQICIRVLKKREVRKQEDEETIKEDVKDEEEI